MDTIRLEERLTHHPMQPGLSLRAGETLRRGDVCWINEDGTVWRSDAPQPRPIIDGAAVADYSTGASVALYRERVYTQTELQSLRIAPSGFVRN